jgi:sulfatase modifying factor 1
VAFLLDLTRNLFRFRRSTRRRSRRIAKRLATLMMLLSLCPMSVSAQAIEWQRVGDPGNPGHPINLQGSVAYEYDIAKYEVTNAQYEDFLNSVADADPNGLFDARMETDVLGGIEQTGVSGSFAYAAKSGFENKAVSFLSFWEAARFANWLHNGMPDGAQGPATTEGGAYTLSPAAIAANSVTRNTDALFAIPTRNEWWKAAHYQPTTQTWFLSPAQSQTTLACGAPALDDGNTGSCSRSPFVIEPVGSYLLSDSPSGTFDQGGNVHEWVDHATQFDRELFGGSFFTGGSSSSFLIFNRRRNAAARDSQTGMRLIRTVVAAPAPALGPWGLGAIAVALVSIGLWTKTRPAGGA